MRSCTGAPLKEAALSSLDKPCLRLIRNAVPARHGRAFEADDLKAFFSAQGWYEPNPQYTERLLTKTDRANVAIAKRLEDMAPDAEAAASEQPPVPRAAPAPVVGKAGNAPTSTQASDVQGSPYAVVRTFPVGSRPDQLGVEIGDMEVEQPRLNVGGAGFMTIIDTVNDRLVSLGPDGATRFIAETPAGIQRNAVLASALPLSDGAVAAIWGKTLLLFGATGRVAKRLEGFSGDLHTELPNGGIVAPDDSDKRFRILDRSLRELGTYDERPLVSVAGRESTSERSKVVADGRCWLFLRGRLAMGGYHVDRDVALEDPKPFADPFAKLAGLRPQLSAGSPAAPVARAPEKIAPARAVVRIERKGHAGKELTRIEHLGLRARELEEWLRDLKRSLGCGGSIAGDAPLLQGDQRQRAVAWLVARGVAEVTRG